MRLAMTLVLLLAGPALAQNPPHREGEYGGVAPGQTARPDPGAKPKPKRLPPRGTLSWIGFEAKDGGAQVFFQSVAPFTATQRVDGATLIVSLDLQKLAGNTWRPVDTRFFDNPLSSIVAKATRARGANKRVEVKIRFKNPKDAREATVRTQAEADGMHYVYLTFPEGADGGQAPVTTTTSDPEN
ncbi:MAG: hypothetical protein H0T42_03370 [Deltaproteobacteria bacterium]|nr:hypothetical protein [Deltaproteobacteria bacterium]